MKLTYLTSNDYKFEVAKKALEELGVILVQHKIETPEIQNENVVEVAKFSANWASNILKEPVILSDAGYYIEALNGFPGPFIKYINKCLTADELLQLMKNKNDRNVVVKDCLAYAEPGLVEPVTFISEFHGTIASKKGDKGITSINEIFIPEGYNRPESEISHQEMVVYWSKSNNWEQLGIFLKNR